MWPGLWVFKTHFDKRFFPQDVKVCVLKMASLQCDEAARFLGLHRILFIIEPERVSFQCHEAYDS